MKAWLSHLWILFCLVISSILPFTSAASQTQSTPDAPPDAAPRGWIVVDRNDPSLPDLFISGEGGYQLVSKWKVAAIDFVYEWWGLGDPILAYEQILADKDKYTRAGKNIEPKLVKKLLQGLTQLKPAQTTLTGNAWTDDYPACQVELTGTDGQRILLISRNTGNPGSAPWTVLYNGRLYTQYGVQLGEAIWDLFQPERGGPAASFSGGDHDPGRLYYTNSGWPAQLWLGFTGLLPIANHFTYWMDETDSALVGRIEGQQSVGGYGNMVIGNIAGLRKIEITSKDGKKITCTYNPVETSDPSGKIWDFRCPVAKMEEGETFRFPILVSFITGASKSMSSTGELYGQWGIHPDFIQTPIAEEIASALRQSKTAQTLIENSTFIWPNYVADTTADSPKSGNFQGEIIFGTETSYNGQPLRFSIGTPFVVRKGKLTRFDLTQEKLDELLKWVTETPLLERIITTQPDVALNLWYAEPGAWHEMAYLANDDVTRYQLDLSRCAEGEEITLPAENVALKAFSFSKGLAFNGGPEFVILGDQIWAHTLFLYPDQPGRVFDSLLLPHQLDLGEERAFAGFDTWLGLTLKIPEDASPEEIKRYQITADALPGTVNRLDSVSWEVLGATVAVNPEGLLEIIDCKIPEAEFTLFKELKPVLDVSQIDESGNLVWAISSDRVARWNLETGQYLEYLSSKWMKNAVLTELEINPDKMVWVGTANQGVFGFDGKSWVQYLGQNGPPGNKINDLLVDSDGYLWAATDQGVAQYDGIKWTSFAPPGGWIQPRIAAVWEQWDYPRATIWFASDGGGLASKTVKDWKIFTKASTAGGLASDSITSLLVDGDGKLWVGTSAGISTFDGRSWKSFNIQNGLPSNRILTLFSGWQTGVWVGTDKGLARYLGAEWKIFEPGDGLPGTTINRMTPGITFDAWLATEQGLVGVKFPQR